jgi:hypothetical protein
MGFSQFIIVISFDVCIIFLSVLTVKWSMEGVTYWIAKPFVSAAFTLRAKNSDRQRSTRYQAEPARHQTSLEK